MWTITTRYSNWPSKRRIGILVQQYLVSVIDGEVQIDHRLGKCLGRGLPHPHVRIANEPQKDFDKCFLEWNVNQIYSKETSILKIVSTYIKQGSPNHHYPVPKSMLHVMHNENVIRDW